MPVNRSRKFRRAHGGTSKQASWIREQTKVDILVTIKSKKWTTSGTIKNKEWTLGYMTCKTGNRQPKAESGNL